MTQSHVALEAMQTLGLGLAGIALLAWFGAKVVRSSIGQRRVFRVALLAMIALSLLELSGVSQFLHETLDWRDASLAKSLAIAKTPEAAPVHNEHARSSPDPHRAATAAEPDAAVEAPAQDPLVEVSPAPEAIVGDAWPAARTSAAELPTPPPLATADIDKRSPVHRAKAKASAGVPWELWLAAVWLAVTLLLGLRLLVAQTLLTCFRRRLKPVAAPEAQNRLADVLRALGVRRRVRLYEAPGDVGPLALGVWRPAIVLPPTFSERFSDVEQQAMLAHEAAHVASRDPAWRWLADLMFAAFWWHPALWWLRRRLASISETVADEASSVVADGPGALAACLVSLAWRLPSAQRGLGWVGIEGAGFRSHLARRVTRLLALQGQRWRRPSAALSALAYSLGPCLVVAGALWSTSWVRAEMFRSVVSSTSEVDMSVWQRCFRRSLAGTAMLAIVGLGGAGADETTPSDRAVVAFLPDDDDQGDRPREGARREGDQPRKEGARREGDRPRAEGERREGDRPRPEGDRPRREGERREGDRPRPEGERRDGDRPRPEGERREGDRPRPEGERREGDRPRPEGERREGDRPRPEGERREGDRPRPRPILGRLRERIGDREDNEQLVRHLFEAAEKLQAEGLADRAADVRRAAEAIKRSGAARPQPPLAGRLGGVRPNPGAARPGAGGPDGMMQTLEQLRAELKEMRTAMQQLRGQVEKLSRNKGDDDDDDDDDDD